MEPEGQVAEHRWRTRLPFELGSQHSTGDYIALGENQRNSSYPCNLLDLAYLLDNISQPTVLLEHAAGEPNDIRWHQPCSLSCTPRINSSPTPKTCQMILESQQWCWFSQWIGRIRNCMNACMYLLTVHLFSVVYLALCNLLAHQLIGRIFRACMLDTYSYVNCFYILLDYFHGCNLLQKLCYLILVLFHNFCNCQICQLFPIRS